jgi:hypothetical protein
LSGAEDVGNGEMLFSGYRVSVLEDEKSFGDGWWWWLYNIKIYFILLN